VRHLKLHQSDYSQEGLAQFTLGFWEQLDLDSFSICSMTEGYEMAKFERRENAVDFSFNSHGEAGVLSGLQKLQAPLRQIVARRSDQRPLKMIDALKQVAQKLGASLQFETQ
jgi:hypothetical protein